MTELCLRVKAPFAVFRKYVATEYRGTYEVMPPSVAYGFVLNVACIDTRTMPKLPDLEVAVGLVSTPQKAVQLQQIHRSKPSQDYNRQTGHKPGECSLSKREFLVDYDGVVAVRCDATLADRIRKGLKGDLDAVYGVPFLGDNDYLVDIIREEWLDAKWYFLSAPQPGISGTRLTTFVDRRGPTPVSKVDYYGVSGLTIQVPAAAWVKPYCERRH